MSCSCDCHAGSGTYRLRCSIDSGSSGVPGVPSCSPCVYSAIEDAQPQTGSILACINGCTDKPADDDHTPVPRLATRRGENSVLVVVHEAAGAASSVYPLEAFKPFDLFYGLGAA